MSYSNGQIPDSALVSIRGRAGARLLSGPAATWERICDEVQRRYGWRPVPSGASDAYRPLSVQVSTFLARYVPARTGGGFYGDIRWWNGVRYVRKQGASAAAVPGTSNHGKGRAVDVSGLGGFTGTRYAQFAAVAIPLGWSNAEGRSVNEPWHWVDLLSPETVSSGHAVIPGVSEPTYPIVGPLAPLAPKERHMRVIKAGDRAAAYIVGAPDIDYISTQTALNDWLRVCGQSTPDVVGQEVINRLNTLVHERRTAAAQKAAELVLAGLPLAETFTALVGSDIYLIDIPRGTCERIPDPTVLSALGKRYADPARRITITPEGLASLERMAAAIRDRQATTIWSRTLGAIKGKPRTAGQGIRLAAQAATGDPIDA